MACAPKIGQGMILETFLILGVPEKIKVENIVAVRGYFQLSGHADAHEALSQATMRNATPLLKNAHCHCFTDVIVKIQWPCAASREHGHRQIRTSIYLCVGRKRTWERSAASG